jgi:hypothetical protein
MTVGSLRSGVQTMREMLAFAFLPSRVGATLFASLGSSA